MGSMGFGYVTLRLQRIYRLGEKASREEILDIKGVN